VIKIRRNVKSHVKQVTKEQQESHQRRPEKSQALPSMQKYQNDTAQHCKRETTMKGVGSTGIYVRK